jgi:hypothetical protein
MTRYLFPLALLCACSSDGGDPKDTSTSTAPLSGDLVLTDAQNYSYTGDYQVIEVPVASGVDSTICFDAVTTDIRGRPMDPTAIDEITLSNFYLTTEEITVKVVENSLDQGDVADYREVALDEGTHAGKTCVNLSDFSIIGNPLIPETEFLESADNTWLATLWKESDNGRNDILMSVVVVPVEGEKNTAVNFSTESSVLTFDADLASLTTVQTSPNQDITVDWAGVTTDVSGFPFDVRLADRLVIGKVAGTDIDAIEANFLQLYEQADEVYFLDVYGLNFSELTDNGNLIRLDENGDPVLPRQLDGTPFTGFTTDGTWLMGFDCTTCTSPAPVFLTVVDVM